MTKALALILLFTSIAHAQVATVCENRVVNVPRMGAVDPATGRVISIPWNGPNTQVIRTCHAVAMPTQTTAPIPEAEKRQLEALTR
jgi:hypothetical protein